MVTIFLRTWSRQYPWLHNTISPSTLRDVEREIVLCNLTIENIPMKSDTGTLDLCYSRGQTTNFLSTKLDLTSHQLSYFRQSKRFLGSIMFTNELKMPFAQLKCG
ncbi:MAG: hypothetical protein JJP05_05125 [cyanobacterium endosymbiont of Rhopalodia gibba]